MTLQELSEAGQIEGIADQVHELKEHIPLLELTRTIPLDIRTAKLCIQWTKKSPCQYADIVGIQLAIQDCPASVKDVISVIYKVPASERTMKRYQSRDIGQIKKTIEKLNSAEISDDEFLHSL